MKKIILAVIISSVFLFTSKSEASLGTSAQSAILMDMNSKRIMYEKNSHARMLTASIAKIMTAIVAIEHGNLEEYVKITEEDNRQVGSALYIATDDSVLLKDLIYGLMLRSGNDAAHAIAVNVGGSVEEFVYLMNETAKKIGMTNSTFENPSGLDEVNKNYSTSYDMALLMSYAFSNETYREINKSSEYRCKTLNGSMFVWNNKHRLIAQKGIYNGGKTGFTEKAGRTLVTTASKNDMNLVVVTFEDGNDWVDHKNLFDYGFANFKTYLLFKKQVLKQDTFSLPYYPALYENIYYTLKNNEIDKLSSIVILKNNPTDDVVGRIEFYLDGKLIICKDLVKYDPSQKTNESFFQTLLELIND